MPILSRKSRLVAHPRAALLTSFFLLALTQLVGFIQEQPAPERPDVVPNPDGRIIDRIEFEGLKSIDPTTLASTVRIPPGTIWNRDEVAAAANRLAATGKFEGTPYAEARESAGKLVLVFVVQERPFVAEVALLGNKEFSTKDLLAAIDISIGSPISDFAVAQARTEIADKYKKAGFSYVQVDVDAAALRDENRLVFTISEGPRIKVRSILFEGISAYSPLKLSTLIETKTYLWIFRTGAYDEETAERDAAAIQKFYVDRGYLNARVGHRVELEGDRLALIFQVDEGKQHIIRNIKIVGNTVFDTDRIRGLMQTTEGGPIDADVLAADRKKILADYGTIGYIYTEVTTSHVFAEEDPYVDLTVTIDEREQYRFGRVVVRGNERTKDKVVRRELRFFPEQLYNTEEAKAAEQRLIETRLFSEATITPQGDDPGVRDALVNVTEGNTTDILFAVGVTTNSGLIGSVTLEQRNFDLFDWPRNGEEFFKGRAFRGAGQTLRLQIEPGTELTRASINFREPYLFDKELGYNLGAYAFQRGRGGYDERRIGFNTSIDKRFREGWLKDWAAELAARFEHIDISSVKRFAAQDIKDVKGGSWLTTLKASLLRDKTDSRWLPSKGNRFKLSWEQAGVFGGDYEFSKVIGEYDHYITLKTDEFDRKHILQFGASVGDTFGGAPVFERFYAGGTGSVRGFAFRGITPRAGLYKDAVGGEFMVLANTEYSFPLVGETVRGVTFLDMGTVEDDFGLTTWRAAVGFGARVYIKYFGPVPLSFDLGFPISSDSEDDKQIFSFSFGASF